MGEGKLDDGLDLGEGGTAGLLAMVTSVAMRGSRPRRPGDARSQGAVATYEYS